MAQLELMEAAVAFVAIEAVLIAANYAVGKATGRRSLTG